MQRLFYGNFCVKRTSKASSFTRGIKAVFFDFGGTLVYLSPSKEELFFKATRSIGLRLKRDEIKLAYRVVNYCNKYSSVKIRDANERSRFYQEYNRQLCEVLGISSCFDTLHPIVASLFSNSKKWKVFKDVLTVLPRLRKSRVMLSVVANWDANLGVLMEGLKIKHFFDLVVSSQELGIEKPDPEVFKRAVAMLPRAQKMSEVMYIGNEYELDIVGARAAGFVPVLIDRDMQCPHADCMRFDSLGSWYNDAIIKKGLYLKGDK
jgi:putative hydrolase of the HAD superfamily